MEKLLNEANSLARVGSWEIDLVNKVAFWSTITKEIHEVEPDFNPSIDNAFDFFKDDNNKKGLIKKINESIENRSAWDIEFEIITAKKRERWIKVIGKCDFNQERPTRLYGSIQDIDNAKKNELAVVKLISNLEKQTKELILSNNELEQFAYIASHDLQEPIRMVKSFMVLLEKKYGPQLDITALKYINIAIDGANKMESLIHNLLKYSLAGTLDDDVEKIDPNKIIDDVKQLLRLLIKAKDVQIISDNLPEIVGSKSAFSQVFYNLISNAIKYSREDQQPIITIKAVEMETVWQFCIADNGIGISPENLEKIFVIFKRIHKKDEYSGSGIGLAICKKLIELAGGKIWVESEPGEGSSFYFTINKLQ